jgi:hypothetical protein
MEEVYKTIDDYDNYEVSNMGNVRNKKTGLVLKLNTEKWGYKTVSLCKSKNKKTFKVHRIVALTFIPNCDNKPFIDHIDRNKQNNIITNLRWVTCSENAMNTTISKNNKTTKTGVYYHKGRNRWNTSIMVNGVSIFGGSFKTFEEAKENRNELEKLHFKAFQAFQNEMDRLEFEFQQAIK